MVIISADGIQIKCFSLVFHTTSSNIKLSRLFCIVAKNLVFQVF